MRYVTLGLLGLVCVAVAAVTFLVIAAPVGWVRDEMIAAVEARTGRTLAVAGGTSMTFYPVLGIALDDVTLSGPPGMPAHAFMTIERLKVSLPLLPLLAGKVEIESFVLEKPVLTLLIDKSGRGNWDFAAGGLVEPAATAELRGAVAESGKDAADGGSVRPARPVDFSGVAGLTLGDVRIVSGRLRYGDARTGVRQEVSDIDIALSLADVGAPLHANGQAMWQGRVLPFEAHLGSLAAVLEGRSSTLAVDHASQGLKLGFDGEVRLDPALALAGKLEATAPSLRAVLDWLGSAPAVGGLGAVALESDIALDTGAIAFTGVTLQLDGATAKGAIALRLGGERPSIKADLQLDRLNLDTYLAAAGAPGSAAADEAADAAAASVPIAAAAPASAESAASGWSTAPIDFTPLRGLDVELKLATGALAYETLKVGRSSIVAALKDGVLKVRFADIALYDGKGLGALELDGGAPVPALEANFTVTDIAALPLLRDGVGFDWVAGSGTVSIGFTGAGRTQQEIVGSLIGQGRFALADGAIVGIDIPRIVRNLQAGKLEGFKREPARKTDFSALSGSFSIAAGLIRTDDVTLVGPLMRAAAAGTVSLPQRAVDLAIRPRVVADLDGQGGDIDAAGIEIPLRLEGPWSRPGVNLDLDAIAKDPNAALDAVKKLGKNIKNSKDAQKAIGALLQQPGLSKKLKGLLGQPTPEETGTAP